MINPLDIPFGSGAGTVSLPVEAAHRQLQIEIDGGLKSHMGSRIDASAVYKTWKAAMPRRTPQAISQYQRRHGSHSDVAVDAEIASTNFVLPVGQVLYHGGLWWGGAIGSSVTLVKPLSTSLLPCVARMEALYKAKAYDAGVLELMVLTVRNARVRAYVLKNAGTSFGHEHEVLIGSGATLILRNVSPVQSGFPATAYEKPSKLISTRFLEVDVL